MKINIFHPTQHRHKYSSLVVIYNIQVNRFIFNLLYKKIICPKQNAAKQNRRILSHLRRRCITVSVTWLSLGRLWRRRAPAHQTRAGTLQCGFATHVPRPVVVVVRVVVWFHVDFDLRHWAGHPTAHRHGRRRRAGDLQVEGDTEEG